MFQRNFKQHHVEKKSRHSYPSACTVQVHCTSGEGGGGGRITSPLIDRLRYLNSLRHICKRRFKKKSLLTLIFVSHFMKIDIQKFGAGAHLSAFWQMCVSRDTCLRGNSFQPDKKDTYFFIFYYLHMCSSFTQPWDILLLKTLHLTIFFYGSRFMKLPYFLLYFNLYPVGAGFYCKHSFLASLICIQQYSLCIQIQLNS